MLDRSAAKREADTHCPSFPADVTEQKPNWTNTSCKATGSSQPGEIDLSVDDVPSKNVRQMKEKEGRGKGCNLYQKRKKRPREMLKHSFEGQISKQAYYFGVFCVQYLQN